jgi:hypothetical protein
LKIRRGVAVIRRQVKRLAAIAENRASQAERICAAPSSPKSPRAPQSSSAPAPLAICHLTGLPPTDAQCRRFFRRPQVGIPDNVWNMDARAGANTEVDAAGVTIEERMALSTHTTVENSERYRRKLEAASRRAEAGRLPHAGDRTEDGE